jgi:hypothetical protein
MEDQQHHPLAMNFEAIVQIATRTTWASLDEPGEGLGRATLRQDPADKAVIVTGRGTVGGSLGDCPARRQRDIRGTAASTGGERGNTRAWASALEPLTELADSCPFVVLAKTSGRQPDFAVLFGGPGNPSRRPFARPGLSWS